MHFLNIQYSTSGRFFFHQVGGLQKSETRRQEFLRIAYHHRQREYQEEPERQMVIKALVAISEFNDV